MNNPLLLMIIFLPLLGAAISLLPAVRKAPIRAILSVGTTFLHFILCISLFTKGSVFFFAPWISQDIAFSFSSSPLSSFILVTASFFLFLTALYAVRNMDFHPAIDHFLSLLLFTASLASGAFLANNFVLFLFFWEALLITLYAMIAIGGPHAWRTGLKGFVLAGTADFALILGIALLWKLTGTLSMSAPGLAIASKSAAAAFILMALGAMGKAGAMPFHTWIPDAAIDAPLPVMALLPGALEKLLGIYLFTRIVLDFFVLIPGGGLSITMMTIGSLTILFAVAMALIQKDFKRLLSYHAVRQVGYMILGIGTCLPIGIIGGLFHMLNNALYKSGLFFCAGSVERATGTTDMELLGGLGKRMPLTAITYFILAAAISGIWPLNGFVSKEMVIEGAFKEGWIFFASAAWIGAIFTFVSFLKAGHAIFLGKTQETTSSANENEWNIWAPPAILALLSILFGIGFRIPLERFFYPALGPRLSLYHAAEISSHGLSLFTPVALISICCLVIAFLIHLYGWKKSGKVAHMSSDVIHRLPVIHTIYNLAENRIFDIYEQGVRFITWLSNILHQNLDRPVDAFYEKTIPSTGKRIVQTLRTFHNGFYANYLAWCVGGLIIIIFTLITRVK